VVVLPVVVGWVAVLVDVGTCVVVLVEVLVGVLVCELVVVELLEVVLEVVLVCVQSWAASRWIVLAPWLRFEISVELTEGGRLATAFAKLDAAVPAAPHWPAPTAAETESSWLFRVFAWSLESRPEPPPQATSNATAKPSPAARSARGAWRIRERRLEARPVGFPLASLSRT
jgi:hypothetical protein